MKIFKFVDGNTYHNLTSNRLEIYNGIVTSPIVSTSQEGKYCKTVTQSGNVYITVYPTIYKP